MGNSGGLSSVIWIVEPGTAFARKVMTFPVDADRLARFEREARLLASLNHPNIGAIYGVEERDGLTALVLELVEGETLADKLRHGSWLKAEGKGSMADRPSAMADAPSGISR